MAVQVEERGEALAESERRYREMFTRTSAIQLVLEPETWCVIDANPAACMFFESSLARLVGTPLKELTGVGTEPLAAQAAKLEEGAGELVLRPAPDQSGSFSSVELRLCQYRLRGQRVIQVTVHDITTRLELEQNLREAQKLRAVGELASGIAHDFNNLLAVILGFSELISYEVDSSESIKEHLHGINEAGEKGADLVRQLLAFGRRQHLELEELELSPIVSDFVDILRRLLDRRIEIVAELDPLAGYVQADRSSLERVLMNLALNSRDAMPEGGRLTLRTRTGEGEGLDSPAEKGMRFVCLSVEDNGGGMDEEVRSRMFEPFYTTKSVGKGTGLGLSTVHGIVGQSGGRICVTSAPGEGTCVELYFPMVDPRTSAKDEGGSRASQAELRASNDRSPLRVLLVDDEPGVRQLVATLLRSLGHSPLEAEGGEAALAAIRGSSIPIDLLLTDVRMPGLSGPELAERAHELAPQMQVLFMSGFSEHIVGMDSEPLLAKPFSATQLASAISEARLRRVAREEG